MSRINETGHRYIVKILLLSSITYGSRPQITLSPPGSMKTRGIQMNNSTSVRNEGLTPSQERAIQALLSARSIAAAARQARSPTKLANKQCTHFVKSAQIRSNPDKNNTTPRRCPPLPKAPCYPAKQCRLPPDKTPSPPSNYAHGGRRPAVSSPRLRLDSRRRISHD